MVKFDYYKQASFWNRTQLKKTLKFIVVNILLFVIKNS